MTAPWISDRILVTGSGGRLGSEIRRLFGARATAADLPELDLTDRESVRRVVSRCRPRLVINTAAYTHVDRAESEPDLCWEVNLRGVERLVEACRQAGAALVQISTDYVFDGRKRSAYLESDEPNPLSTYGRSKLEAERVAAELSNHLIVRTAGLFGPAGPASRGSFVETILRLAEGGKPIRVVSDRFASPTYTCDLARAIESLLLRRGDRHLSCRQCGCRHLARDGRRNPAIGRQAGRGGAGPLRRLSKCGGAAQIQRVGHAEI